VTEDEGLHNGEEDLRLLHFLGIREGKPYPMEIYLTEEENSFARHWLEERRVHKKCFFGFHPGTSTFKNHAGKRWSERSFAALIDVIAAEVPASVFLIFGGPEERKLRETIVSQVSAKERVISVDFVTVRQAAALMKKCSLFVSNDSGPMHMAAACGVPTVAIFGPTNPVWLRPWGVRHEVVRAETACKPCFRYSPKPMECNNDHAFACIRRISVEQVLEACRRLLQEVI
jgi:lipopolysaccharide heptosyltransferase II